MQFEKAVRALCDGEVEFVVMGSLCEAMYGSSRATLVFEVFYSRTAVNLRRLVAALAPFHPRPRGLPETMPFIWGEVALRNAMVLTLRTDLGEIDLLAEVAGLGAWDEVKARSILVEAFDRRISILDLQSLIEAKRAAGRAKDLDALPELESLLEAGEP